MKIIIRLNIILMSILLAAQLALAESSKTNNVKSVEVTFNSLENNPEYNELAKRFLNPPNSARPGVYWYFMDGNLNREEMTADLESMKEAGIGNLVFL